MKVLAVGGGSGGHVTPVVAVIREIARQRPAVEFEFWCDKKFSQQAKKILAEYDAAIPVKTITSGKLRRYNTLPLWRHIVEPTILWPNLRDGFFVGIGFIQSLFLLFKYRPDVVFTKGGFVCLPVGYAAALLKIPLVIHDSDAHPGLTNRLLAPYATAIATGSPLKYYNYPVKKSRYVGIPVDAAFKEQPDQVAAVKQKYKLPVDAPLVVITGGGLGARNINNAIMRARNRLLKKSSIVLISGKAQYNELSQQLTEEGGADNFVLLEFVSGGMAELLNAADAVIARAGATTLLELAALKKPSIIVPNALLTGGHQLKNAQVYVDAQAAIVVDEAEMISDEGVLVHAVEGVLNMSLSERQAMGERFYKFARPQAAQDVAEMIIDAAKIKH